VSELSVLESQPARGAALLLVHCSDYAEDLDDGEHSDGVERRTSAYSRLELKLGGPLARRLVGALVGPQGLRGSSSP
jgi:hypothetical protein